MFLINNDFDIKKTLNFLDAKLQKVSKIPNIKSNLKKFFEEIDKFETQTWYTGNDKNLFQVIENKAFFIEIT